jgi:hypothetical protein
VIWRFNICISNGSINCTSSIHSTNRKSRGVCPFAYKICASAPEYFTST